MARALEEGEARRRQAVSRGIKTAGVAGEGRLKTPRARKELDLPLCVSLEEPRPLIEAGEPWKPPFRLEQYNCAGID